MIPEKEFRYLAFWVGFLFMGAVAPQWAESGSAEARATGAPPDWVKAESPRYPRDRYLTGVGYAETRRAAEDGAYAAISRIFQTSVQSTARDLEAYLQFSTVEPGQSDHSKISRKLILEQVTKISTEKVLENVFIAEIWEAPHSSKIYALAVMDRVQTAAILRGRIAELDHKADSLLSSARTRLIPDPSQMTHEKLETVRALYGALRALSLREGLNADLEIVDPAGRGIEELLSVADVGDALRAYLARNFRVRLDVSGPYAQEARGAVMEGLTQEGLVVLEHSDSPDQDGGGERELGTGQAVERKKEDLLVAGGIELEPAMLQGRPFFRWRARFSLIDPATGRAFAAVARDGREGHLTVSEAEARAVRAALSAIRVEIISEVARSILGDE